MDWKEFIVQVQGIYSMGPLNPWKNPVFFYHKHLGPWLEKSNLGPLTSGKDVPSLWNQAWERILPGRGVGRINAMGLPRSLHVFNGTSPGFKRWPKPPISTIFPLGFGGIMVVSK